MSKVEIRFNVRGEPYGKGRPRFTQNGHHPYTPTKTTDYEDLVRLEYNIQAKGASFSSNTCLMMEINAFYSIPKGTSKWKIPYMIDGTIRPLKKPDWDNIGKIIADSLNKIAYNDDAQIVESVVRKFYSTDPHVEVTIRDAKCYSQSTAKREILN